MVKYDTHQHDLVVDLLSAFQREDITFVVPRGHTDLPDAVPGSDIDLLISAGDFEKANNIAESKGFEPGGNTIETARRAKRLAIQGLNNRNQAISKVKNEPMDLVRMILFEASASTALRGQYQESKRSRKNVYVHLFNHLAYVSPYNEKKVRVNPSVEQGMFDRRSVRDGIAIPAPPDELVHLLCRGVFDKHGAFPTYYVERCDTLYDRIKGDRESENILSELLSEVYFNADTVVYSAIENSLYSSLRRDLMTYDDY